MKVIEVLRLAKGIYLKEIEGKEVVKFPGMCWCIKVAANSIYNRKQQSEKGHPTYCVIQENIPEFIPSFLGSDKFFRSDLHNFFIGLEFWWPVEETQPRIEAFDKLIDIYKDSDKEFKW